MADIVNGLDSGRLQRITAHLQSDYIDRGRIAGCQTLVARRGDVAYASCLGRMDIERNQPMRDDTIFRFYSMTKPITSVALMMLYEDGRFQLNDPVSRVIPSWRNHRVWVSGEGAAMETRAPKRPMTFRHLLNHSGGLTYGAGLLPPGTPLHPVDQVYHANKINRNESDSMDSYIDKLSRVPLRYDPGERWQYSVSTDVCGYLVQALSGMPFDRFVQERILGPLGMVDTAFTIAAEKVDRFAANYRRGLDKKLVSIDDPGQSSYAKAPGFPSGGGGLLSTMADYFRFAEMLRRGGELDGVRILGPRTIELMRMNHLPGGQDLTQLAIGAFSETANEGVGFGLGFATTLGQVATGSLGAGDYYWGGLASTLFWIDPAEQLVVIFLTQLVPSGTFDFRGQLKSLVYSSIVD